MAKPTGHAGCRVRELVLALTTDDVRRALEESSAEELAPVLQVLGVHPRAAGRKLPKLLRTRLGTVGTTAAHATASFLTQPLQRQLQELAPDHDHDHDGDGAGSGEGGGDDGGGRLVAHPADGPLAALRARWPVGLVRLTLEMLWHADGITTEERDRLLALAAATGTCAPPSAASVTAVEAGDALAVRLPVVVEVADSPPDVPASALDMLVAEAVSRARAGGGSLRAAIEELLALDPGRAHLWFQYGRVLGGNGVPGALTPWGAPARRALALGRLHAVVAGGDHAAVRRFLLAEGAVIEQLLSSGAGGDVAVALVAAHLDDPRAAARLLDLAPRCWAGWERLPELVEDGALKLAAAGREADAEILLRALEEALRRWEPAGGDGGPRLAAAAAVVALRRVACRRRRSDFVGAGRLLGAVDPDVLDRPTAAVLACERALVAAQVAGADTLRFPRSDDERTRLRERLRPAHDRLREAVDLDPGAFLPNLLLGMLLSCEGDPAAAGHLTAAHAQVVDMPELAECAIAVRFHAALARLRLLEPGTDEGGYHDMAAALDAGYRPGADDLVTAAVALEAHGSPYVGAFLASAMQVAPGEAGLTRLLEERARTGDAGACGTVELFGLDTMLPLATRFELLDAALTGAGVRRSGEDAERLAGAIDDVLVRANDARLDARFADALATNETLRLALEPAHAEALRLEVLRRIGRLDEARAIARALFYRAAGGGLRAFDPADLFDVLVELGLAPAELDELARLLPSPPDGEEPPPSLPRAPVHVLFVGGNETQDRYRAAIDAAVAARYQGAVTVTWVLPGWRSNWGTEAARIEAAYEQADAVVLLTFVRTQLGQRVRRSAGEHGLPWVACTGHGRVAIERAIDRAVAIVSEQALLRR